jgi:hypothetical protein
LRFRYYFKTMIQTDDLRTFSGMGKALWVDAERCEQSTVETLSAVTLLNLTPDRAIEKACVGLLEGARRAGSGAEIVGTSDHSLLSEPFYRLSVEEKMLLVALHVGRWSYARISRILKMESAQLQECLWRSRLQLGSALSPPSPYPAAPSSPGPDCPAYDSQAPWTQRFFDQEILSGSEQFVLKQHLLKCNSCSQALRRCRELYFRVDVEIKQRVGVLRERPDLLKTLEKVIRLSPLHVARTERPWQESLSMFLARRETQISLVILAAIFIARTIFHK